ncbi:MAG TPA: DUF1592 domain-containing protein [Pirellulales bacterium]|nr:DUF1592 domain-containing protein [Pirellulales bacterium]
MTQSRRQLPSLFAAGLLASASGLLLLRSAVAQDAGAPAEAPAVDLSTQGQEAPFQGRFQGDIRPLLDKYCVRCHNADEMKSGIRVDHLDGSMEGRQAFLWKDIRGQVFDEAMPPEDQPQPNEDERHLITGWIDQALAAARARKPDKNGSVRRLTVSQYRNTLRDLLGIDDDFTDVLPPDAVSKDGFLNNSQTMLLSPLLVESYFSIAEKALDRCLVDESTRPEIQNFHVELGAGINPAPCPDNLILGALSHLLKNDDFVVTQLSPAKPFEYKPFIMQTRYRFIEGYQGNDTVRGWREYDSIYHAVFACMRGSEGYPKGLAYETVPAGLLLRPAIPSDEVFQVDSTYGPKANFKISLRELPDQGRFRVTVKAAKYDDGLLLDPGTQPAAADPLNLPAGSIAAEHAGPPQTVAVETAGVYQIDVHLPTDVAASPPAAEKKQLLTLALGGRRFSGTLGQPAFLAVRLPAGPLEIAAQYEGKPAAARIVFTPLDGGHDVARRFAVFEKRLPRVGVHLGLRRDCGSTLSQVGETKRIASCELEDYVFEGAIGNFPSPDVEKDNVNYLAGIREIGVRSEYTDGRDMPRLLIRSVEFEGPLYDAWPPATHRSIFVESPHRSEPAAYAREILRSFATRAFRRPVSPQEEESLLAVWRDSFGRTNDFRQSVKDGLLVVLSSPQFLFLIENSSGPEAEPLDEYELASKLSYFLWNGPPDERLLSLAAAGRLRESLDAEVVRMIQDDRFGQFIREFASQWLNLDKLDVVETDRARYPRLSHHVKTHLRREPGEFLAHLIRHNRPLASLVQCDFILANEVVAGYYDLADRTESGFGFVEIKHDSPALGGLLSQAGILAGLSDGRESNPVKRGAWLARKIIAEPPDDPPPNVPALPEDDGAKLTLRQKLERHRDQQGCAKCHAGIDPWGLPLEQFDAGGLFKRDQAVDARSTLPDKTEVPDANGLKAYLANERLDQVAFSFLKHLSAYATGRGLSYQELELLKEAGLKSGATLSSAGYPAQDLIRFVVKSELFLEK